MKSPANEVASLTSQLVQRRSVLGNEGAVAELAAEAMAAHGFQTVEIDSYGNAVGVLTGQPGGRTVLLDAHIDTVDVYPEERWSRDPFSGEIDETRVHGRGTSDMKGALAAMIVAGGRLAKESFAGRLVVSATVGEELVEGAALVPVMDRHQPDVVIIGEASELNLVRGGRGRAEMVVETAGRPSHASTPEQGLNAVHEMIRAIAQIESQQLPADPFVGAGVMCLTDIVSVPYPAHSVVPSGCRATYERRLLPGDTRENVLGDLKAACEMAEVSSEIRFARTDYTTYTGVAIDQEKWFPAWLRDAEDAWVERARDALLAEGLKTVDRSWQFCTNAAYSASQDGVVTLGFGPSSEHLAHTIDEWVAISQLEGAVLGYLALGRSLAAATDLVPGNGKVSP